MEDRPIVSVIVTVYKAEPYLGQCIDSILNQTYTNLELILVDDGSPDHCGTICDAYAAADCRVKVIHQENQGAVEASNVGIAAATGEYIMFVDGDDWIGNRLIVNVMAHAPFPMALFGCSKTDVAGNILSAEKATDAARVIKISEAPKLMTELLKNSLLGYACNKIYHRNIVEGITFVAMRDREDLVYSMKALQRVSSMVLCTETGYYYRQREDSAQHMVYNCPVPNYIETTEFLLNGFGELSCSNGRELGNIAAKIYLMDAVSRYIWRNDYLDEATGKAEVASLFANDRIRSNLSWRYNTCFFHVILTICFKLRLSTLFYFVGGIRCKRH